MIILLVGASGFIGSEIARTVQMRGHTVFGLGRDLAFGERILPDVSWRRADLARLLRAEDWAPLLAGIEIVINASGALQTGLRDNVAAVQSAAMKALFAASRDAGIRHVVQISACGAERQTSEFMSTKAAADAALRASGLSCTILRPGLVIGRNGFGGTELLRSAAALPNLLVDLPGTGNVQCVAMGDLVEAVVRAVERPEECRGQFDLVEPQGRPLGDLIALHRGWLGLPPARWRIALPVGLLRPVNLFADGLGWLGWRSPLRTNSMMALVHGVSGEAREAVSLLGREALSLPEALASIGGAGKADRWHARLALVYPLALGMLVLLWLGSGILGLARQDVAVEILLNGDVGRGTGRLLVTAGASADILVALCMAFRSTLALALKAGIALSLAYLAASLLVRPDLWLDPLGPMLKVLPVTALMLACIAMSGER